MLLDVGHDFKGEGQGAAAVFEAHDRCRAAAHGVQKRPQFCHQRLAGFDRGLGHSDLRVGRGSGAGGLAGSHREDEHVLTPVVDRNVLAGLKETQLAVKLATQPDENSRRTLAMSVLPERIGRPTARTSRTGELTKDRTMSRSWIMRSKTTSTSRARGVKTLRRWTSKNMGWVSRGTVARTAGLKRSRCPTCAMR